MRLAMSRFERSLTSIPAVQGIIMGKGPGTYVRQVNRDCVHGGEQVGEIFDFLALEV